MIRLLTLLLLIPTLAWTQKVTTTDLGGPSNIYNDALKRYLVLISENKKPIYDTLFIQQDNGITDSLMSTINGSKVIVADSSIFYEQLRQSGSFVLYKLFPLSFDKGVFYISLVPFLVTEKNGEVDLANTGTFKVDYLFDKNLNSFRFITGKSYGY